MIDPGLALIIGFLGGMIVCGFLHLADEVKREAAWKERLSHKNTQLAACRRQLDHLYAELDHEGSHD